jgi:PIN domain nuclease of toxin-antitoxin system
MILLDTHAAIWLHQRHRRARALDGVGRLHLSPATLLELQFLVEAGRLRLRDHVPLAAWGDDPRWRFDEPPSGAWFSRAAETAWTRDPFDRLLAAHAHLRGWKLATADQGMLAHLPPSQVVPL